MKENPSIMRARYWIFLLLLVAWMALVTAGQTAHGLIHLLPLCAVLMLAHRVHRHAAPNTLIAEESETKEMATR